MRCRRCWPSKAPVHQRQTAEYALIPQGSAELFMPVEIGDYTDFYASVHHATNVGAMFRPDNPLLPNYKWVPIGYHGRASSIVLSGTPIRRPCGQRKGPNDDVPVVGPVTLTRLRAGTRRVRRARQRAGRDHPAVGSRRASLRRVHAQRLVRARHPGVGVPAAGPVPREELCQQHQSVGCDDGSTGPVPRAARRRVPKAIPHRCRISTTPTDRARGGFAITMEVALQTARMRADGMAPERITRGSALDLYWTMGQMLTHHASNGCPMRTGDLLGSGTVSGAAQVTVAGVCWS